MAARGDLARGWPVPSKAGGERVLSFGAPPRFEEQACSWGRLLRCLETKSACWFGLRLGHGGCGAVPACPHRGRQWWGRLMLGMLGLVGGRGPVPAVGTGCGVGVARRSRERRRSRLLSLGCIRARAWPKSDLKARRHWRGQPVLGASKGAGGRVTGVPAEERGLESYGYGGGG